MFLLFCNPVRAQNGLIAYYPFNGNASDESINGNHIFVNGATLTPDRFSKPDSAYHFDGEDDFMAIPFNPSLHPTSIGVTVWVKISEEPAHGKYILTSSGDLLTPPFDPFRLRLKISRKIAARFEGNEDAIHLLLESKTVLDLDQWYFIAAHYDEATGEAALFINGKLEARIVAQMTLDTNDLGILIGASQLYNGEHDSTAYFSGSIDDIRILNRALTRQEIQTFFLEGTGEEKRIEVLDQNFPNPFNPETTIRYVLSAPANVVIKVYNVTGQTIRTILNENQVKGVHFARWDGKDEHGSEVSSGLYIYRVRAGKQSESRKMLLIK